MKLFKGLVNIEKSLGIPLYLQISNALMINIRNGTLKKGLKLPGSRELASFLRVHRKTVLNSYYELSAQGWIEISPRKGVFVAKILPELKPREISKDDNLDRYPEKTNFPLDEKNFVQYQELNFQENKNLILTDGFPDTRLAPTELLIREFRSMSKLSIFNKYYRYGDPRGPVYLLETLSSFLADTRNLPISSRNILITKGSTMGIYLSSRLLLKKGHNVIVEDPGYFGANNIFKQIGAVINRIPVDESGIDTDKVEQLCRKKKIKLIYIIPHHQYPTTVTLIPERRKKLLELAEKYKLAIIEDDYDYDFQYNGGPVLPMASLDHNGNVIYIGTLSKTLVPAMRLGFVIAPENFINAISHLRRTVDFQGDSMMEVAIGELYRNGTMIRHIKKVVKIYHQRRDNFCKLLKEEIGDRVSFKIPDGGMCIWAKFNDIDLVKLSMKAAENGLTISSGKIHNITRNYSSTRLGFAALNFSEQEKAIKILKDCL